MTSSEVHLADLCDAHGEDVRVAEPLFADFGGVIGFYGSISTVKCFEDNSVVRNALETQSNGRVLVVDGGGSLCCALLGDRLSVLARQNGWSGIIVYGCIRDSAAIARIPVGVKALGTHPRKSGKRGIGERDVDVHFAGLTFRPGDHVYADADGIVVSPKPLLGSAED